MRSAAAACNLQEDQQSDCRALTGFDGHTVKRLRVAVRVDGQSDSHQNVAPFQPQRFAGMSAKLI